MPKCWGICYLQLGDALCEVIHVGLLIHCDASSVWTSSRFLRVIGANSVMLSLNGLNVLWQFRVLNCLKRALSFSCEIKVTLQVIRHLLNITLTDLQFI